MADMEETSTAFAREFIDQRAGTFHPALGVKSYFDPVTSKYQSSKILSPESSDLEEALKRYKTATFLQSEADFDPLQCTWADVIRELEAAVSESEARGKKFHLRVWRSFGTTGADIFIPGLAAIPNQLCILQGGLAVIFSVSLVVKVSIFQSWLTLVFVDCSQTGSDSPKDLTGLRRHS
jgi:hypothetical protein